MPSGARKFLRYVLGDGKSLKLTEKLQRDVLEKPEARGITKINVWATKVTLDIIGIAAFGQDFDTLENSDDILAKTHDDVLKPTPAKMAIFGLMNFGLDWLMGLIPGGAVGQLENGTNEFSDEELVDQLRTLIAAGHETTSSSFTWVVYMLALNPEIQSRLREEIQRNILEDPLTDADQDLGGLLESLPLLNGVCNETLRYLPTVPLSMRVPNKDTTIVGQSIPKGTDIFIIPYTINRCKELWGPTACEVKPERWIDTETGRPNNTGGASSNYAIMTFLHGAHTCIGQSFAKVELRALVATFVRTFAVELAYPGKPVIPTGIITTKPEGGMWVKLKQVDG
ncbi:hypothetical protein N7532_008128 [Penicillium argentinense]|uniref:Cytochrome P450 n=1 Tax=Penicillium argentinense TaxID=1131581 RepID=A0A9W9K1B2_9EURO|nr:uncharacterized protein N7532_008128 [Penicillium argentinense]KAJ5089444.1 hypothetical protein N7532_008128 [Penicillium argentinense]